MFLQLPETPIAPKPSNPLRPVQHAGGIGTTGSGSSFRMKIFFSPLVTGLAMMIIFPPLDPNPRRLLVPFKSGPVNVTLLAVTSACVNCVCAGLLRLNDCVNVGAAVSPGRRWVILCPGRSVLPRYRW